MMEMSMNSVERIDEYLQIEQDAAAIVDDYRPAENWPHHGCIDVKDLSIRYSADQPLVLDKISFHVGTFEKIGIVGRTGAGKSTLSLAMFRIVPHDSGRVLIDGMDIGKMGLWDLRSRLTIIPQDPVLFSGTVRTNLDPFDKHDDAALWAALKRVHFLESMQTRPGHDDANGPRGSIESKSESSATLNSNIPHSTDKIDDATEPLCGPSSNEASAAQGQRQSSSVFARALLQASRIIIMDEATASVDHSTDARIQNTIRTEFSNATVLTIAHRLSTVMDYDKILVLDRGQVSQYGRPHELLEDKLGLLYQMCMESGEMDLLVDIAAKKASLNSQ
ncbi:Transporter of the ATP-binding cassette (ABC) [Batrachochytrium dendrobatidis]|nr:Transporter of the ATP-binding cassette (ABC) [Batrachochytrium dendrobatidis]